MSVLEFFKGLDTSSAAALIITSAVGLTTIIQIAPIKINPWSWIARKLGHAINGEVIEKVDKLEHDIGTVSEDIISVRKDVDNVRNEFHEGLETVRSENKEALTVSKRVRILRFGDEIRHNQKHSKDHFDQIMMDITEYESYCQCHPHFQNDITVMTIDVIKESYKKCLEKDTFL